MSAPDLKGQAPELTITERPRSIVAISARKGSATALAVAMKQTFGIDLPDPRRFTDVGGLSATWIQPKVWLVEGEPEASGDLFRRVENVAQGSASIVDQSDGRSLLQLTGYGARAVLATCCRLDLHARSFRPGAAASTLVAHVPCVVRALDGGFELLVGSTFARWLIEDLTEASAAYGACVVPASPPYRSALPTAGSAR